MGSSLSVAFKKRAWLRAALLNFVLLGTCALIGDGILTPAISGERSASQIVLHAGACLGFSSGASRPDNKHQVPHQNSQDYSPAVAKSDSWLAISAFARLAH